MHQSRARRINLAQKLVVFIALIFRTKFFGASWVEMVRNILGIIGLIIGGKTIVVLTVTVVRPSQVDVNDRLEI
jgi:hypothetical protein